MADNQNINSVLAKHLDDVRGTVKWVISFGFVATILAVQGQDQIQILNLELTRREAFLVLSAIYVVLCLGIWENFRRIRFHLSNQSTSDLDTLFRELASHPWLFNPFTHYLYNGKDKYYGFSGLIVCFWMCLSGLYALIPLQFLDSPLAGIWESGWQGMETLQWLGEMLYYYAPVGILIMVGYFAMEGILHIFREAKERFTPTTTDTQSDNVFIQVEAELKKAADAGIGLGGLVFGVVMIGGGILPLKPVNPVHILIAGSALVLLLLVSLVIRRIRTRIKSTIKS